MKKDRKIAVFYTCATCNLHCRYCNIDKNPALKDIDDILAESFKSDYYFEKTKQLFNKWNLERIETWGGEPFTHMDRIYPTLHKIIEYFPYFKTMHSSTNFSFPTWNDQFFGLMSQFNEYPYRDFIYDLQLSCDGPEYINDAGRGKGTTKKCLENFSIFLKKIPELLPSNVKLSICLKPTLDNDTIKILCSKEKIIEYYKFFEENFIEPIRNLNKEKVEIFCPIPNTAVPSPVTVEEGKIFAAFCKLCREIEQENITEHYFKFYTEITPYTSNIIQNKLTYKYNEHTCGVGSILLGILPFNKISACHEGFTQLIESYGEYLLTSKREETGTINFQKYIENTKHQLCLSEEEYEQFEQKMSYYRTPNTTARLGISTSTIITLAMAGQIDKRFVDEKEALKAAIFMQSHVPYCIKNHLQCNGSIGLPHNGLYKLLLNGAMEYIQTEEERKYVNE